MPILATLLVTGGALYFGNKLSKAVNTSNAGDALKSDIAQVKFKGFDGKLLSLNVKANFDISFRHTNPTNTDLIFNYMFLDIAIDNTIIASVREENLNQKISKSGVTNHTVRVVSENLFVVIPSLIYKYYNEFPKMVKITGNIKVNNFSTDFNKEYPLQNAV